MPKPDVPKKPRNSKGSSGIEQMSMMPKLASHAKVYGEFFPFAVEAYMNWAEDVREHNYPEDKHGYHMDAAELEKFMNALEKF